MSLSSLAERSSDVICSLSEAREEALSECLIRDGSFDDPFVKNRQAMGIEVGNLAGQMFIDHLMCKLSSWHWKCSKKKKQLWKPNQCQRCRVNNKYLMKQS